MTNYSHVAKSTNCDSEKLTEQIIENLKFSSRPFNGVVLIAKGEEILCQKAIGNIGQLELQSQFGIGSISKQMTAVCIMQTVETGSVNLHGNCSGLIGSIN